MTASPVTRPPTNVPVHPALLAAYPQLRDNDAQMRAVAHSEGPLLIIAGPGSGKTQVLVWRTLNLLLTEKAEPGEILVCTFTEKAAYELRDRISLDAKRVGYLGDLSDLLVGTVHGICNRFLLKYRHRTRLLAGLPRPRMRRGRGLAVSESGFSADARMIAADADLELRTGDEFIESLAHGGQEA